MKENKNTTGTIRILILLSILLALSGMVATVSADGFPLIPNQFYGTVTIDGEPAHAGTIITAYIDGDDLRGSVVTETAGEYGAPPNLNYLSVNGSESDNGKTIVFKIDGDVANENDVYKIGYGPRIHDLSIGEPPAGATPTPTQGSSSGGTSSSGGGGIGLPGALPTVTSYRIWIDACNHSCDHRIACGDISGHKKEGIISL
jgi:hypothetical protein